MPSHLIRRLLILGGLAIIGIVFIQSYWVIKNWDLQDKQFDSTVNIVLRKVANNLSTFSKSELPKQDLIQRKSSNTYAVNINSKIDASVLEDYLYQQLEAHSLNTDFEYAVYDCYSDHLVYGNYCELGNEDKKAQEKTSLPKFNDLIYYFVVRFPQRQSYLISNMWLSVTFSIIAILAVLFFLYSTWVILQQKRLSELQKDFINNMTHEFKTPISSIKIAADVLSKHDSIGSDKRLAKYANIIITQNKRLNDQVEKVLNIARVEKQSFELNYESFSLHRELNAIVNGEQVKLSSGHITMSLTKEDAWIKADKLHFINVITNIIDNAIKYCVEKPSIQVKTTDLDSKIMITISDNGIGIDKEAQKKLFEKFYRVSTGNVHDVKGFGLGLFYVKNIADAHGWDLNLESEPNVGTKVNIIFSKVNQK